MKVVKKIFKIVFVLAFFIFAVGMSVLILNVNDYGVTQFGDISLIIIPEDISSNNYEKGDLALVKQKSLEDINVGDEVFIYQIEDDKSVSIDVGHVGDVHIDANALALENGVAYSSKFIAGSVEDDSDVYANIGSFLSVLQSRWIFFFAIVVPCFLIFIYQIYALIIEIKYGDQK